MNSHNPARSNAGDVTGTISDAQEHGRLQAALEKLSRWVLDNPDVESLLREATLLVAETLQVEFCSVMELSPGGRSLRVRAGAGWGTELSGHPKFELAESPASGRALLASEATATYELGQNDRGFGPAQALLDRQIRSGIRVAIEGGTPHFGMLGAFTTRPRRFTEQEVNYLHSVANVDRKSVV